MIISVTKYHIDNGVNDCEHCPIALAIKEQVECSLVIVSDVEATIDGINKHLPDECADFIYYFDNREDSDEPAKPFKFELEVIS